MKLYAIRDWDAHFENNRSRSVKELGWIAIPNRHDGENFTLIMGHPKADTIFTAWVLMLQVASKCQPRGSLVRGNGAPHTPESLAAKTRGKAEWFKLAFQFLEAETDWLDVSEVDGAEPLPKQRPAEVEKAYHPEARTVLHLLNQGSGKSFREVDSNLSLIHARLSEPGVDLEGVKKMVKRQCARWKGTAQEEYLRPETLFNKTKFDAYYAAKDQPANGTPQQSQQPPKSIVTTHGNY